MAKIKIRALLKNDITTVKALISHPMETGRRIDEKTRKKIPAHFIQRVVGEHNDAIVFSAWWGTGVSATPFVSFRFKGGQKGDTIKITWVDNMGLSANAQTTIQ